MATHKIRSFKVGVGFFHCANAVCLAIDDVVYGYMHFIYQSDLFYSLH